MTSMKIDDLELKEQTINNKSSDEKTTCNIKMLNMESIIYQGCLKEMN